MQLSLLLTAFLASLVGAALTSRRLRAPGAVALLLLFLAVAEWQLTAAVIATRTTVESKRAWGSLEYIGIASVATLWLHFVLRHLGDPRGRDRRLLLVSVLLPASTLLLALTSAHHTLLWTYIEIVPTEFGTRTIWHHGPLFWFVAGYNYLALAAATALLVRAQRAAPGPIVFQLRVLLLAGVVPWIANLLYLSGLGARGLDPTPIAFGVTALCAVFALTDHALLALSPARMWRS